MKAEEHNFKGLIINGFIGLFINLILIPLFIVLVLYFYEETKVTVSPMTEQQISAYVATGEPMDKAGAYGIQGRFAVHIQGISGDYNNVVGLPVARIYQEMRKSGIEILQDS